MKKNWNCLVVLLIVMLTLSSCGRGHGSSSTSLASITVTPAQPGIAPGTSLQFRATGNYSNGGTADLTTQVTWTTSAANVAAINSKGLLTAFTNTTNTTVPVTVTALYSSITGSATLSVVSATSPTKSWTVHSFDNPLLGIVTSATLSSYVIVGQGGIILTSQTGTTWTLRSSGTQNYLWSIATSTTGTLAAVGEDGTIITSPDGSTWNPPLSMPTSTNILWGITSSNSQFVAVGELGDITISSDDGANWTHDVNSGQANTLNLNLNGVVFSSDTGTLVAVGQGGIILTSPSVSPTAWSAPTSSTTSYLWSIAYGGMLSSTTTTQFVAVGSGGTILTSPTATTASWTPRASGVTNYLDRIKWSASYGQFLTVGSNGTILTSPDGVTWTHRSSGTVNFLYDIATAATGSQAVAVGLDGTILTSPDLVTWTTASSVIIPNINGSAWSGVRFAAVGDKGLIISSLNGSIWSLESTVTTTINLNAVASSVSGTQAHGIPEFVAVGDSGTILTSPSGTSGPGAISWTRQPSKTAYNLNGVAYGILSIGSGTVFVAVGDSGTILSSPSGTSWTTQSASPTNSSNLKSIAYGVVAAGTQPLFVAVGDSGTVLTSTDGTTWLPNLNAPSANLISVTWSGSEFVAADFNGQVYLSTSGTGTWQ